MGNSPSRLAATAPSEREPFDKEGKFPARRKASLFEGGGTALAVTEGGSSRRHSTSRLTATAPSEREPFGKEGKSQAGRKASLLEGGGTAQP